MSEPFRFLWELVGRGPAPSESQDYQPVNIKSADVLNAIIDCAPTAIVTMGFDGTIEYWSAGAERLLGLKSPEALGQNIFTMIPGLRSAMTHVPTASPALRGASQLQDCAVHLADRSVFVDIRFSLVDVPGADVRSLALLLEDSNLRRNAENATSKSLTDQRNMLVREVHHRVKNHLHGLIALLRLQALGGPKGDPFDQAVDQLRSIALAYGVQAQSNTGNSSIALLLERTITSLGVNSGTSIHYEKGSGLLDSLALSEGDSVPIALIVMELLANAQSHGSTGEVDVVVHESADRIEITFANKGSLPENFSWENSKGFYSGLTRAKALLPTRGVKLTYREDEGRVIACLTLDIPLALAPIQAFAEAS